jgi:hypothetical protein
VNGPRSGNNLYEWTRALKYLEWSGARPARYRLRPHNPAYPTLEVDAAEVHVDGVFRGLLRGRIVQELMTDERRRVR